MTGPTGAVERGWTDVVTAVVILMDGVTRLPVRTGVDVRLWDPARQVALPNRLIRNLSGHLVLVNERADQELTFRIDPAADYRGPVFVTFTPAADGVSRVVALERRPDAAFDATETLVRGSVVRTGGTAGPGRPQPVAGLTVTASPRADAAGHQFPATTDERGVFALVVGLVAHDADDGPTGIPTTLRFAKAELPAREFTVDLDPGRTQVFRRAIDLDGDDRPPFLHQPPDEGPTDDE